jgi:hypothetical protein
VTLQELGGVGGKKVIRVSGLEPPVAAQPISAERIAISQLRLTPKRFRVAKGRTAISARKRGKAKRVPAGSSIRFTLSRAGEVRITIERKAKGRRAGKRCVKPTRKLRGRKRCTRWVKAGRALERKGLAVGAQRIPFSGRIGRKALAPGSYRMTAAATDPRGAKSKPKRVSFTVVQPRT